MTALLLGVALCAFLASFAFWGYRSYRRLWRSAATPYETVVYRLGVRQWGVGTGLVFSAVQPAFILRGSTTVAPYWIEYAALFLIYLIIGIPIWLWGGYWWGRTMATFFGLSPGPDR